MSVTFFTGYINSWFPFCSGCFIAVSAYEGRLALFSMSMSKSSDIIDEVQNYRTIFHFRKSECVCVLAYMCMHIT